MPKNKSGIAAFGILLIGGCSAPPVRVFVDLDRVPKSQDIVLAPVESIRLPALERKASLPARPAAELFFGNNEPRLRTVEQQLREARHALFDRLRADLERAKLAEVRRIERDDLAKLDMKKRERIDALFAALWIVFVQHADRQFPPLVKLTQLVGFPDPGPNAEVKSGIRTLSPKWAATAPELRAQIDSVQASYYREVAKLTNDAYGEMDGWLLALKAKIIELQAKALEDALAEAERLSKLNESILLAERVRKSAKLDAVPSKTIVASAPSVTMSLPKPSLNPNSVDERVTETKIWAAGRGYELVSRGKGRDATEEFLKWRTDFLAGQSSN